MSFDTKPLGELWTLRQGALTVGRLDAAPDLDLGVDHPTTSSRHARLTILANPSRAELEDLGSTNGTFVNGQRLQPGVPTSLKNGDALRFGACETTLYLF